MAKQNKNWIQGAIKRPGAFKRKAKEAGMSTQKFAKKVTSSKSNGKYSARTQRQANLAQTLAKFGNGTPGSIYGTPTAPNDYGFVGAQQAQMALQQAQAQAKQVQDQKLADAKFQEEQEKQNFNKTMATQGAKFIKDANAARTAAQNVAGTSRLGYLNNANLIGAGASLAGTAIQKLSDDDDDTRINFGEGFGGIMQGAGAGASIGSALGPIGTAVGAIGGAGLSAYQMIKARNNAKKNEVQENEYRMAEAENQRLLAQQASSSGYDMGYNIGSSFSNAYLPGQQMMMRNGGEMIKRADGSYSQRGLWDNIRANKGSGKKPTKEMLEQEKKIKSSMKSGGYTRPLPGGAIEFVGPKHAQGGIRIDKNTEVEGGETMDRVKFAQGGEVGDYIFSDHLKINGKTFAQRHKEMLNNRASQADIQQLAKMQEAVAEKQGKDENGPRGPQYIAKMGGIRKYQSGPSPLVPLDNTYFGPSSGYILATEYSNLVTAQLDVENAFSFEKPEDTQPLNEFGGYNRAPADDNKDLDPSTNTEVTLDQIEAMKLNNPWYDWTDFDHTDKKSVMKFQEAFNAKVPEDKRIKVDGMVGEQTSTAFIPYRDIEMPEDKPEDEGDGGGDEGDGGDGGNGDEGEKETPDPKIPPVSIRENVLLPWQTMGPLAALGSKYPQPQKVTTAPIQNKNLGRVNYNAERAMGSASTNAVNKFIQNNNSGPGAIAAQMANINAQRENNRQLANAEANVNKQLYNQEAMAAMQASQYNSQNAMQANMFNAQNQNTRNLMEYEKRMNAADQLGRVAAQYGMDERAYRAEERMAEANQISGEYTRQKYYEELARQAKNKRSPYYGMGDTQLRDAAARMTQNTGEWANQDAVRADALTYRDMLSRGAVWTPDAPNSTSDVKKKRGGKYISKLNKVRR